MNCKYLLHLTIVSVLLMASIEATMGQSGLSVSYGDGLRRTLTSEGTIRYVCVGETLKLRATGWDTTTLSKMPTNPTHDKKCCAAGWVFDKIAQYNWKNKAKAINKDETELDSSTEDTIGTNPTCEAIYQFVCKRSGETVLSTNPEKAVAQFPVQVRKSDKNAPAFSPESGPNISVLDVSTDWMVVNEPIDKESTDDFVSFIREEQIKGTIANITASVSEIVASEGSFFCGDGFGMQGTE